MVACKNCQNTQTVKNGFVRDKQRYKCKICGYNFVLGDERRPHTTRSKRPYVLSYTHLVKPLLASWATSLGYHGPRPITGFATRLPS